jgi:deoxyribodipyrimidine photolyase-related protein
MSASSLRVVLGDQLTPSLSALRGADRKTDVVLMMEVDSEARRIPHHKKKIVLILAAMRSFADELKEAGWRIRYVKLDDPENSGSFSGEVERAVSALGAERVMTTEASEWSVLAEQKTWANRTKIPVSILEDDRFLCSRSDFLSWAEDRRSLRMEFFYRWMRRRTGLLMDGDEPVGGKWNFDHDNRKPGRGDLTYPSPFMRRPEAHTRAVLDLVARRFPDHFGDIEPFWFPVRRSDAQAAAAQFMAKSLPRFGDYQDAMIQGERFLFHSLLSPLLNIGLLDPLDLCRQAEEEYRSGRAPLNAVEGFIRQIIGWREFIRGVYWREGPDYLRRNALNARRPLPAFYWTGETDMTCMSQALTQTREDAYAHHIQRLMVTGNFALLAGIDPFEVHEWYHAVYADAFEWVEAPNTIGMSQFADGGVVGSKPYAASGAYIARMSDYCRHCRYDVKQKSGSDACPFNYLYWDFLARNRERFEANPRMSQMYRTYDRLSETHRADLHESAARFLDRLDGESTEL